MAKTDAELADEAQAILDGQEANAPLPGLEADTKVSVLGMQFSTSDTFALGERVELRVVGYVNFAGDQLLENEGKKHIVKIQSSLIEVVPDA